MAAARRASAAEWLRPRKRNAASSSACTPSDRRLTPASARALNRPASASVGLASRVISIPVPPGNSALARSITTGVKQFFHENPPPGTYVAWLRDEGKIAAGPREHVVARGESLALIAQRYQISLASLRSANKLNGDVIKVGQTLQIPATALAAQ